MRLTQFICGLLCPKLAAQVKELEDTVEIQRVPTWNCLLLVRENQDLSAENERLKEQLRQ